MFVPEYVLLVVVEKFVEKIPVLELYASGYVALRLVEEILLLNVLQSVLESRPRFVAEAVGRLRVKEPPSEAGEPETFASVPEEPRVRPMDELASALFGMFATETVGVKVKVPLELVMVCPTVTPLLVADEEVARTRLPVWLVPYDCFTARTPVLEMVTFPVAPETLMPEPATFERTPEFEMTLPLSLMPEPQVNKEEVAMESELEEPTPVTEPERPRPRVAVEVAAEYTVPEFAARRPERVPIFTPLLKV